MKKKQHFLFSDDLEIPRSSKNKSIRQSEDQSPEAVRSGTLKILSQIREIGNFCL